MLHFVITAHIYWCTVCFLGLLTDFLLQSLFSSRRLSLHQIILMIIYFMPFSHTEREQISWLRKSVHHVKTWGMLLKHQVYVTTCVMCIQIHEVYVCKSILCYICRLNLYIYLCIDITGYYSIYSDYISGQRKSYARHLSRLLWGLCCGCFQHPPL